MHTCDPYGVFAAFVFHWAVMYGKISQLSHA
jgi:hypothetical protein